MTLVQLLLTVAPELDAKDPAVIAAASDAQQDGFGEVDLDNPLAFNGICESRSIRKAELIAA